MVFLVLVLRIDIVDKILNHIFVNIAKTLKRLIQKAITIHICIINYSCKYGICICIKSLAYRY